MKIIQHYLNFRPTADWIVSESRIPYLEIGIDVPVTDILAEWNTVKDLAVSHRANESISEKFFYGHNGWKSLVIYGSSADATSDRTKPFNWTHIADKCPITKSWIETHWLINEDTNRIRFMLLEPGGYILPHVDRPNAGLSEFNIAITNPKECVFRFSNYGNVPFESGKCMMMDISNQHLVVNNSEQPRLHIIVHGKLKNNSIIEKSYENCYYNQ